MRFLSFLAGITRPICARWPEVRAAITWVVDSWIRPADVDASWEQGLDANPERPEQG